MSELGSEADESVTLRTKREVALETLPVRRSRGSAGRHLEARRARRPPLLLQATGG
jgi:hypothetical protein